MPGWASPYLRKALVDHATNAAVFNPPSTILFALTTTSLDRSVSTMPGGVEPTSVGYARVTTPNDSTFWTPADPSTLLAHNLTNVVFPAATADYPACPGWAIISGADNQTILYAGTFDGAAPAPVTGQVPTIFATTITLEALA